MKNRAQFTRMLGAAVVAVATLAPVMAAAHGPAGSGQTMMSPGQMMQGQMGPGQMMQGQTGPGQMGPGQQMGPGAMNRGTMGQGQMGPGMMGQGMMGQMGLGQMGPGMMGMVALGNRVVPMPDIGVNDVRRFLQYRVELQGYARLRVGKVEAKDDDTFLAEIETVDGALVQRLEVDRHSGLMTEIDTPAEGQKK